MLSKLGFALLALALMLTPAGMAQDAENPTVAILRFGPLITATYIEDSVIGGLLRMGVVSQAEFQQLVARQDLEGERINILWGDAQFDHATAQTLVESMLDKDVDAIVTSATPVTVAAAGATSDLDDAPVIIFGEVYAPYAAGIADAACIKPSNVTGISPETPYSEIIPLLMLQDPALETIGTIYSLSEISGVVGAETIKQLGVELGLTVLESGVNTVSDLALAAEAMIERGAQALVIPSDTITFSGLPIIMQSAAENSIPVFHSMSLATTAGATVAAGTSRYEWQGQLVATLLMGHLSGQIDIGSTGIGSVNDLLVGINLDMAAQQDLEISESLMERADVVIHDGVVQASFLVKRLAELGYEGEALEAILQAMEEIGAGASMTDFSPEVQEALAAMSRAQGDPAAAVNQYLAAVHCTDEMIAEQQAALDAAEG